MTLPTGPTSRRKTWLIPGLLMAGLAAAMMVVMRLQGRLWLSQSGAVKLWHSDVWSNECSQQFTDPYSITHVSHGLLFAFFFWWMCRIGKRRDRPWLCDVRWHFVATIFAAAVWEAVENTEFVINRYRSVTMSFEYKGDTILNSTGDMLSCAVGFFIARTIGWKWTLALFAVSEVALLLIIRDNLTLNVIMLITPVTAIKEWQMQGHLPPG